MRTRNFHLRHCSKRPRSHCSLPFPTLPPPHSRDATLPIAPCPLRSSPPHWQADGLDVLRAVAELVGVARPAGLSGIERSFLRLLAAAGAAGVALDKRFAFR